MAEISILREKCDRYENARTKIIKQFEGCYLADDIDDYKQGEHHAYQTVLNILDEE